MRTWFSSSNSNCVMRLWSVTVVIETEVNEYTVQSKESAASTPSLASLWQLRHCADCYILIVFHVRQKCVPFTMNICNTLQSNLFYTAHQQTMKMSPLDLKEKRLSINRETNMVIRSMKRTDKGPNETLKTDINIYIKGEFVFAFLLLLSCIFITAKTPHLFTTDT